MQDNHSIAERIDAAHAQAHDAPRYHLGASALGHACDRHIWLGFRWAFAEQFDGRILRLFRRGQNEEATVIADLRRIGVDVRVPMNGQDRIKLDGHLGGSLDGRIAGGVPGAHKEKMILEVKTHGRKSFDQLVKLKVKEAKPQHWVQMQVYMHAEGVRSSLYYAICKDDDTIYTELVEYDEAAAVKSIERGHRISLADRQPEPMPGASPSWFECKYCPHYAHCFPDSASAAHLAKLKDAARE